ncbi:hypothetical protein FVEN_g13161 [Fusarium venenatum]|nr:hypothetical protein FVEN_g13161 [Fusarium venenatum]
MLLTSPGPALARAFLTLLASSSSSSSFKMVPVAFDTQASCVGSS